MNVTTLENGLLGAIAANATAHPEKVIVLDAHEKWTWARLVETSMGYARALSMAAAAAPKPGITPVLVDRSGYSVAAILGALMTGAAYAPLLAQQPRTRLSACLAALPANAVCNAGQDDAGARELSAERPVVGRAEAKRLAATASFNRQSAADDLLYVLFTSGSTGVPKGVLLEHGNIVNTLLWQDEILDWRSDDVIGCAANFSFDIAQFDLLVGLVWNIPIAIFSNANNIASVLQEAEAWNVTSVFSVPALFSQLLRQESVFNNRWRSLRRIVSGGDFFPPQHVLQWLDGRPDVALYNVWGPTETSIVNTMYRVTDRDRMRLQVGQPAAVGKAHWRMPFVLLNENGEAVKRPGESGEICMLGTCVSRGYLNNPAESERAYFMWEGKRAYKTQDMGCSDEVGNLYIIGRIGSMIKVAGYRIDLREIEHAAMKSGDIHQAVAFTVAVHAGIEELWLGVEMVSGDLSVDVYRLKTHLRAALPRYMVPKRIVPFARLPRTDNGKIDRKAVANAAALQTHLTK